MEKDANKRYYFKELMPSEVLDILSQVMPENAEVYLWRKGQTKEKMEHFQVVEVTGQTLNIRIKGFLAKLAKSFNENEEVFFKVCFGKKQFFSNALLYIGEGGEYCLDLNGVVYEGLQRTDYRLNASKRIKIQMEIEEELYYCRDISAGGISFLLDENQAESFTKGVTFEKCMLTFNKVKYPVIEALVVGRWEVKEDDETKIKVGITFNDMKEKVNDKLCVHINSEAREEEILKQLVAKRKSG